MIKTFISHSSADHSLVTFVQKRLDRETIGLDIFVDDERNRAGDDLQKMIEEVKKSIIFIPVMSDESLSKDFVRNEIETALSTPTVNVFPVKLNCTDSNIPCGIRKQIESTDKVNLSFCLVLPSFKGSRRYCKPFSRIS